MTDYNTLQKKRNMIVGSIVLIAILALICMIGAFGELPLIVTKHRSFDVFVQFPNAPGIQKNTPIRYCGYQIGKVFRVEPPKRLIHLDTGKAMNQVKVGLAIDNKFEHTIPSNVEIRVMKRSMGSSYVEFVNPAAEPTGFITREIKKTFQGGIGSSTEFIPKDVQEKLRVLVDNISTVAIDLHEIVGDRQNQKNIKSSLENFAIAASQAEETFKSIQTFSKTGQNAFSSVSEGLNDTLKQVRVTLNAINEGEGTVGKLVNDPGLYENLLESSKELQIAIEQLKLFLTESREKGLKIDF
jgi:phospholipid/cholesterol/gamma-HCH transport system substrate-binding protein